MSIETIIEFFKWCSIVNISIIIFSAIIFLLFPNFSYNNNKKLFPGNKNEFKKTIYFILLCYKMMVIIFNVVPYFVLLILK